MNNKVLDCLFGGQTLTPPPTLHVGLSLTRAYKGGYVAEPLGEGYARVAVANDLIHFPPASLGRKSNALAITFPEPVAGWGLILSVFVADAARGGERPGDGGPAVAPDRGPR